MLGGWLHVSLGNILFLEGVIVAFVNLLLLGRFDYFRLVRNLLFITPFSYLLAFFERIFVALGVPSLPLGWRIAFDVIGLFGVACAVSLYQRANLIMHPNDDSAKIAQKADKEGTTLREAAIASGKVTPEQFDEWVDPLKMTNIDR